ncbi:hypothetical protein JK364_45550 [Streptomyces sp. 110]|uniref:Uncharacterized protein n=2 Tax=Streptomyces TaxID=1883 RepID=A0ABS0RCE2_9ACTN|nr:hypothetical protein [Streptomyces javensis]MBL1119556.1 hypothetical protein [Streptomyces endocoffeicus]
MEGAAVVEVRRVAGTEDDPRAAELRRAVARLRRDLAAHPAELPDRAIADDELAALDAMARTGAPELHRLRRSLLLIAGALGSVSALGPALTGVRAAIDQFGSVPRTGIGRD